MRGIRRIMLTAFAAAAFVKMHAAHAACDDPPKPKVNWQGCDKSKANLQGDANLSGPNLAGANLSGTNLEAARLMLANLRRANLQRANLRRAKMEGADLRGADLRGADLRNAYLADNKWEGAYLTGAIWTDGRKCGPNSIGRCK